MKSMNSNLLSLLLFDIVSQMIQPSPSLHCGVIRFTVDFVFMKILGSKKMTHNFFSSKSTLIGTFILLLISLQIYRIALL